MAVIQLRLLATGLVPIALSACAATAPSGPAAQVLRVPFGCAGGERIEVVFDNGRQVATLVRGGRSIELPQQRSGSGFIYGDGSDTIRGKGKDLTVELAGQPPVHCKAQ